jgi:hypothetical protein
MTPKATVTEITTIIRKLVEASLSDQQNWPALTSVGGFDEICIPGNPPLNVAMKNIPYKDIYDAMEQGKAFHIRMLDGAFIQMCYRFSAKKIVSHRLCMFPAPELESFDNDPDIYERDELYADIVGKNIVHFPVRFDFDIDPAKHVDVRHPKSHLTLGQYPHCRIPLAAPLSPARFISFILRNFYHNAFYSAGLDSINCAYVFPDTISAHERRVSHLIG